MSYLANETKQQNDPPQVVQKLNAIDHVPVPNTQETVEPESSIGVHESGDTDTRQSELYQCTKCSYKFYTLNRLVRHFRKVHQDTTDASTLKDLLQKRTQHVIKKLRPRVSSPSYANRDKSVRLDMQLKYACPMCCKKFKDKWHMTRHIRVHTRLTRLVERSALSAAPEILKMPLQIPVTILEDISKNILQNQ